VHLSQIENWNRDQTEVDALMGLFNQFMHQIVPEAIKRDIQVRVLVSDGRKFPAYIVEAIEEIETKTKDCHAFNLNICVRYL
jgi:undecaprenyl diphosphate synthase